MSKIQTAFFLILGLVSTTASTADFCVSDAAGLKAALAAASNDEQDDRVRLTMTRIVLPFDGLPEYTDFGNASFEIEGGFLPGCTTRVPGGKSWIDAVNTQQPFALWLDGAEGTMRVANLRITGLVDRGALGTGALVLSTQGRVEIEGNVFEGNGGHNGSALQVASNGADILLRDNVFRNNTSRSLTANIGGWSFGGVIASGCHIENNTFVDNVVTAQNGSAGVLVKQCSAISVANNVLWGNAGDDLQLSAQGISSIARIAFNDLESHSVSGDVNTQLEGNFSSDPLLDVAHWPSNGSPLLNSGSVAELVETNPEDLYDAPRVFGAEIEVGAVERQPLFADGFED